MMRLRRSSGFTLLEVLVSVALLALVLGVLYSAYASNLGAIQAARHRGASAQTARIVLQRMSRDLESCFITDAGAGGEDFFGIRLEDQTVGDYPAAKLAFSSLTHLSVTTESPDVDLSKIEYELEEDADAPGMILYRGDAGGIREEDSETIDRHELGRSIAGLEIVFRDWEGNESTSWDERGLPALISIRLTLVEPDGAQRVYYTSVNPGLAVENGMGSDRLAPPDREEERNAESAPLDDEKADEKKTPQQR